MKVKRKRDFYLVNRDGTANLVKAGRDNQIPRFLLCSSQAAAGPSTPLMPVTPEDTPDPITEYGKSKLAGEEVLRSSAGEMWWSILRPPAVYGPSDVAFLPLIKSIKRGIKFRIGRGNSFSIIHVHDLAHALVLALEADHPPGAVWFATDGETHTDQDLTNAIEQALNKRAFSINLPFWAASLLVRINEKLAQIRRSDLFLNRDKLQELTQPFYVCNDSSFRKATGFQQEFDLESGMLQTIEWYSKRGII